MIVRYLGAFVLSCLVGVAMFPASGRAITIYTPDLTVQPGGTVTVPVMIDAVDNLAGLKIVITYDDKLFAYTGGAKTPAATSLMHIVNDRKPGRLVLVMAGARGIRGEKIAVFEFRFTAKEGIKQKTPTELRITESQLMSDALKDLKHDTKPFRIAIVPTPAAPKSNASAIGKGRAL